MTSLFGNQPETIIDLINKPKFIILAQYMYWGLYSNEEDFNRKEFAKKIFDNNYKNNNNLSFFYNIIKKLINNKDINIFDYKTYYENEKTLYVKSIFTEKGKFPNCSSSNNIEKCKFLKDNKIDQKPCKQENKDKIIPSLSLLIKIYNEEKIKEQLVKYDMNPNKDADLVISHNEFLPSKDRYYDGADSSQGGYKLTKFTGGKPIQLSTKICTDKGLLKDISDFINKYINEDEVEKFRCLKKLIDRKKKIDTIIKLYELIENTENTENEEKISKFKLLLVEIDRQIDTFFNGINQLFIKDSPSKELNKLGKYIYKSINEENYDDEDNFEDDSDEDDSDKDDSDEDDNDEDDNDEATNPNLQSMQNHTNTCYINSLLQAIRGCKPLLHKFLEIKERCPIENNNLINSFYNVLDLIISNAPSPLYMLPFCEAVWSSSNKGQFERKEMSDSTDLLDTIVDNLDNIGCIKNLFDFYNLIKIDDAMSNIFMELIAHNNTNLQDALNRKLPSMHILQPNAPFIILRTKLDDGTRDMKTVKTKLPKNGNITIYNQTFKLSSVILNKPYDHYFTITKDGYFSDESRTLGPKPMKEFIKNSEYNGYYGNLYFFERVETQESSDQPQIFTYETIVPQELMEKYYTWKTSIDSEEFMSLLNEIIIFIIENPNTKFAYEELWKTHKLGKMWIMRKLLKPLNESFAELLLDKPHNYDNLKRFFIQAKLDDPQILKLTLEENVSTSFKRYEELRAEIRADQAKFVVPEELIENLQEYIDESKKLNAKGLEMLSTFQGGGKLLNNKYFQKYLKYKNKYLELCKLKSKKNW